MDPGIEGLIEVASPPQAAGKRGRLVSHDWDAIVAELGRRPWRYFVARNIPSNTVPGLRERHPEIEFLGHDYRLRFRQADKQPQKVCDLYVRWTGGQHVPVEDPE